MDPGALRNTGHLWVRNQRRGELLPRIVGGEGVYLFGDDGRTYIDGSSGPVLSCLGHSHPEVVDAMKRQLDHLEFASNIFFTTDPIDELAEFVVREAGESYGRVTFVSGGSEAVETCLRIALEYCLARGEPGRTRFIGRRQSWHGYTLGALSVSGHFARRRYYVNALPEASFVSPANAYRPPHGVTSEGLVDYLAREFEGEILRLGPERVAAFIFEPVVGTAGGAVPAPPGYPRRIREVCDRYGVLMVADEVMCGVGRCGTWRALAHDGVAPDLMALAKGLAGGYMPIGAALYTEAIYDTITSAHGTVATAHTYGGHTVACAAAVAVQKIIKRDGLAAKSAEDGAWLMGLLQEALGEQPYVGDIRGRGLLIAVEFVQDRKTKTPFPRELKLHARLRERTLANGLVCFPSGGTVDGINGDHVLLAPPYIATRAQLEEIFDKLIRSIDEVMTELPRTRVTAE